MREFIEVSRHSSLVIIFSILETCLHDPVLIPSLRRIYVLSLSLKNDLRALKLRLSDVYISERLVMGKECKFVSTIFKSDWDSNDSYKIILTDVNGYQTWS